MKMWRLTPYHTEKAELNSALRNVNKCRKNMERPTNSREVTKRLQKEQKQQLAQIAKILQKCMENDQNVITTTEITGDQLGKSKLLFLSFVNMFKKYQLLDMFKQIVKQDSTAVKKQLLQTALCVATRELLAKADTNASDATECLPRCEKQQILITKRVMELLPDQKDIGENIIDKQAWEQRKAGIGKLVINRFSLPAKLKELSYSNLLDKLLGSEKKEREEKEEEEKKQQQERDKGRCKWAKQLQLPCGQDCFFRNLHGKKLETYQFIDKANKEVTLCCDARCSNYSCDRRFGYQRTKLLHADLRCQHYDRGYGHCIAYLAGIKCANHRGFTHGVPLCERFKYSGSCEQGTNCRRLHKQTAQDGTIIALQYTKITEFARPLYDEIKELEGLQRIQVTPGVSNPTVNISLHVDQRPDSNAIQIVNQQQTL